MSGEKCGAKTRREDGATCARPAGWGTPHLGVGTCKMHFGNNKTAKIKGSAELLKRDALTVIGKLNIQPVEDPLTELAKLAGEVIAWKEIIAERVSFLSDLRYDGEKSGEQIRGEVIVFERALDRCNAVLSGMARLNIDDRLAKISEMQAQTLADVLSAVLGEMGLTVESQREAKNLVAQKLRLASG